MKIITNNSLSAARTSLVYCAAFGTMSGSSWSSAFVVAPSQNNMNHPLKQKIVANPLYLRQSQTTSTRLLFSQKRDDDNEWGTIKSASKNLLRKAVNKVKSLLGQSDDEQRAEMVKKERKDEIKGGINAMLKDMPLPIRMLGRMVTPLLARAADEIAEQSRQVQDMLDEARVRLANDPTVVENLGEPIQVGSPFSQSSSTMSINGKSTSKVVASFPVAGPRGNGVATMEASDGELRSLSANINGRNIVVGSSPSSPSMYGSSSKSTKTKSGGDIIEAEIIEKK